jgi:predicted outer membrane repeat protein
MTGGSIIECTSQTDGGALYLEGGQVIMSGGTISKNVATRGNGGAISILGGDFSMPETGNAAISENAAFIRNNTGGDGGGIYVTSTSTTHDVKVEILSGSITNNSSDRRGGGLCVDMEKNQKINANVTVGADGSTTNPLITTNTALIQGGGLYVKGATANIPSMVEKSSETPPLDMLPTRTWPMSSVW